MSTQTNSESPFAQLLDTYMAPASTITLQDVLEDVRKLFPFKPHYWYALEVGLSCACALLLKRLDGCPAVALEGPSGCGKTTMTKFFPDDGEITKHVDTFTSASFVSHQVGKTEADGKDLLPQIRHKVMITPELRVLLSEDKDKLAEALGTFTRVLDGHGLQKFTGASDKGYKGDYKFALIGAVTPLSATTWKLISSIGTRLLFLDTTSFHITKRERMQQLKDLGADIMTNSIKEKVTQLLTERWAKYGDSNRESR